MNKRCNPVEGGYRFFSSSHPYQIELWRAYTTDVASRRIRSILRFANIRDMNLSLVNNTFFQNTGDIAVNLFIRILRDESKIHQGLSLQILNNSFVENYVYHSFAGALIVQVSEDDAKCSMK